MTNSSRRDLSIFVILSFLRHSRRRRITLLLQAVMMLISGVKRASTSCRQSELETHHNGSSIDVRAATALSTHHRTHRIFEACLEVYRFLRHIDHASHHRRKSATGFQRLNDRFAFLTLSCTWESSAITSCGVSRVIFKSLQNRHTARDQAFQGCAQTERLPFAFKSPKSGMRSLKLSITNRPPRVRPMNL